MKRLTVVVILLALFGLAQGVWAGAKEDAEQVLRQWVQTYNEGNLEAYIALYADDAEVIPAIRPSRMEGKGGPYRGVLAGTFKANPTRRAVPSDVSIRTYGDSTAVTTGYMAFVLTNPKGETRTTNNRFSFTLVKQAGKWLIVTSHFSRMPVSP